MRVDAGEVEVSGDKEDDGAHRLERAVSPGPALGGLEQSVDGFAPPPPPPPPPPFTTRNDRNSAHITAFLLLPSATLQMF